MSVKEDAPKLSTVHAAFVKASHLSSLRNAEEFKDDPKGLVNEGPALDTEMVSGKEIGAEGDIDISNTPVEVDSLPMVPVSSIKEALNDQDKQG